MIRLPKRATRRSYERGEKYANWVDEPLQNYLKSELKARGWSLSELARASDFSPSILSRWMTGQRPSAASLQRISEALGLNDDTLLTLAGYRKSEPSDDDPRRAAIIDLVREVEMTDEKYSFLRSALELMLNRRGTGEEVSGPANTREKL